MTANQHELDPNKVDKIEHALGESPDMANTILDQIDRSDRLAYAQAASAKYDRDTNQSQKSHPFIPPIEITDEHGDAKFASSDAKVKDSNSSDSKTDQSTTDVRQSIVPGQTTHLTMLVDGKNRDVYVHAPADYDPKKGMPMLIAYGGLGWGYKGMPGGAAGMDSFTKLGKEADKDGFLVVYPDGGGIGHGFNNRQMPFDHDDDVKFTKQIVSDFTTKTNVDKNKVFLAGFSEGASFAHLAAAEMPGQIAGVVDVAGWRVPDAASPATPATPVSELNFHSAKDEVVNIKGTAADNWFVGKAENALGLDAESQNATTEYYRKLDGLPPTPSSIHQLTAKDGATSTETTYSNNQTRQDVTEITLPNIKHGWPGSSDSPDSIDASAIIGKWLVEHSQGR